MLILSLNEIEIHLEDDSVLKRKYPRKIITSNIENFHFVKATKFIGTPFSLLLALSTLQALFLGYPEERVLRVHFTLSQVRLPAV